MNNLAKNIKKVEFINNLDNLINELMYSKNNGYINLSSKEAVDGAIEVIEQFDNEVLKLCDEVDFENLDEIIQEKKNELIYQIKKHYYSQVTIWANEVYENIINNALLSISVNKTNKSYIDKIYNRGLCAISWYCGVINLNKKEQTNLIKDFNEQITKALNSKDSDFIQQELKTKTNSKYFLELRKLILNDEDKFLSLKLDTTDKLSKEDIVYFKKIQTELNTYKKNFIKDTIILINSAIESLNLKDENKTVDFIKQVENDFRYYISQNSKLEFENQIELIKKRMQIFQEFNLKNQKGNYFKKLINSLSE